ncbi:MBL fold metallo-hydrolase [Candidatus Nomurabacteria bacterium]|nr:MBL fold metallo-hydrolase [Candidatus Nomurabacteria bacterium]
MFSGQKKVKWILVFLLLFANFLVWQSVNGDRSRDFFTLAVLDVGQGDSIFIEDTAGHQILVDGGPDQSVLAELPKLMSVFDRSIDLLVLTHPHADHLTGLVEILKRYRVSGVLEAGAIYDSAIYDEWHRLLKEKNIPVVVARRGERVILADNSRLEVLAPSVSWQDRGAKNIHDSMVVTRLIVASSSVALLTGDMESDLEDRLLSDGTNLSAQILKVGHHGSKTSTGGSFLRAVAPKFAVISVARENRYGHPHPQTLGVLQNFGVEILRTDELGTITFRIDKSAGVVFLERGRFE